MPEPTKYLTVAEVVARLADSGVVVSDETVRRWAKAGKIRSKRLRTGGLRARFLLHPDDVDTILAPTDVTSAGAA